MEKIEFSGQTVIRGHVIDSLRSLPEKSVHCIVTSPPFFGLRRYEVCVCGSDSKPDPNCSWCEGTGMIKGMEPQLWGGDPSCAHEWVNTPPRRNRAADDASGVISKGNSGASYDAEGGKLCSLCGGWLGQLGLEPTHLMYIDHMILVGRELYRVLRDDGIFWMEIGDSYVTHQSGVIGEARWRTSGLRNQTHIGNEQAGSIDKRILGLKEKNMALIPQRLAIAFQDEGWVVRSIVIWDKMHCLPESVKDRPTTSHSYILMLTKKPRYYYDQDAVRVPNPRSDETAIAYGNKAEGLIRVRNDVNPYHLMNQNPNGANLKSVWKISLQPYPEAHFATYPMALPERCILLSTSERGACSKCGAPWSRIVAKGEPNLEWQEECGGDENGEYHGQAIKDYEAVGVENASDVKRRILSGMKTKQTLGWRPTCVCYPDPCDRCGKAWIEDRPSCTCYKPVPCVVLDPFAGSGTTLAAAKKLGRHGVGTELNPMYVSLIEKRLDEVKIEVGHDPAQKKLMDFIEAA